jgi:hypothetical protein
MGILPYQGKKFPWNRTRDLMISSWKRWPLDHEAGRFSRYNSCVPRWWGQTELLCCRIGRRIPCFYVHLRRFYIVVFVRNGCGWNVSLPCRLPSMSSRMAKVRSWVLSPHFCMSCVSEWEYVCVCVCVVYLAALRFRFQVCSGEAKVIP